MTFDFASLDTSAAAEQGAVMTILHPVTSEPLLAGDKTPYTLTLAGEDSARLTAFDRAARDRALARAAANYGRRVKRMAEDLDKEVLDRLVAATISWAPDFPLDGELLAYSPENARKLYTRLPWLREQAFAFYTDLSNFLKA